ncbi:amidohydrolase family protein [Halobellus sp. Atlit-38R]|uniref:metal-dependent hydrolase family protein n=1 Tax=Halobellus sp. Atlit-38R TaxID=2282131 RepID=UPI000EF185D6|nr:amidohydrolase family protein [Halobellus sp. Atlit-38R]RLM87927.1 amidohydrolase family protein [Halobellus sp. Atlit-38R]
MSEFDVLLHGDVWDAKRGRQYDKWVAVEDNLIEGVYDEKPGTAEKTKDVDLLTPGLIDLHVHLVWDGTGDPVETLRRQSEQEQTIHAVAMAREQVEGGVTTVRDIGSTHDIAISVADASRQGSITGPRIYASGQTIIISGGHDPFWGMESDGVDAVRSSVRKQRDKGARVIKISATGGVYGQAVGEDPGMSELSREEVIAAVDEAHRFDLPVAVHAVGTEGIENSIEAGVDTLEHGNLMTSESLQRMVEKDIAYEPTLYIYKTVAEGEGDIPQYAYENAQRVSDRHWEVFEEAIESDVRILAGSDAGSPNIPHPALHHELRCLVEGGMTEEEALTAATSTPAEELGRPELGVLEEGTPADVVGFSDDPLTDIDVTGSPSVVVADGDVVTE